MTTGRAIMLTLALTWLNPHFYLDAVLMLGTVANSFGNDRWWFLSGTLVASVLWFFGLGYGARLLRGLFARPTAWRVLDSGDRRGHGHPRRGAARPLSRRSSLPRMSSDQQQPPPGWYADPWPSPPGGLRWWDGGQWASATSVPGQGPADAGWWRRVGAYLIDGFIVGAISFVVGIPAQLGFQRDVQAEAEQLNEALVDGAADTALADYWSGLAEAWLDRWVWLALLPAVGAVAYHAIMLRTRSATVGKRALRLRVVPASGDGRLSWSAVARRLATQFVPGLLILPVGFASGSFATLGLLALVVFAFQLLDHLWAAGSGKRALHDLAAGTRVLQDP